MAYFEKFPLIDYNGRVCRNITLKAAPTAESLSQFSLFYPYELSEGERAQHIAYDYYGSAENDWVVMLGGKVIDPYFGWYLTERQFSNLMKKKYGSIAEANELVVGYRVNWRSDQRQISPSVYESYNEEQKAYWMPVISENNEVVAYKRKPLDWVVETNLIISLSINDTSAFNVGERVYQKTSGVIKVVGRIIKKSSSVLIINSIESMLSGGEFTVGTAVETALGASQNVTGVQLLKRCISENVYAYWEAYTAYDMEYEANEARRSIRVLDNQWIGQLNEEVETLLNEQI